MWIQFNDLTFGRFLAQDKILGCMTLQPIFKTQTTKHVLFCSKMPVGLANCLAVLPIQPIFNPTYQNSQANCKS